MVSHEYGWPGRIGAVRDQLVHLAVGLVVALALLVLHDAALLVEHLLVDGAEQMAHAVGFHPQRHVERRGRHVLEVVSAIEPGGAIELGGAGGFHGLEPVVLVVLRAVEHQVLEQVRKAGAARALVLAAHVVPDVDRHHGRLVVLVHDEREPVASTNFS